MSDEMPLLRSCDFTADGCSDQDCDYCYGPQPLARVDPRDTLIATLRAALLECCDIADELGYGHGDVPAHRRIAALRQLAEEKP